MLSNLPGNLSGVLLLLGIAAYIALVSIVLVAGVKQRQWAATSFVAACFFGWPLLVMGGYIAYLYFTGHGDSAPFPQDAEPM